MRNDRSSKKNQTTKHLKVANRSLLLGEVSKTYSSNLYDENILAFKGQRFYKNNTQETINLKENIPTQNIQYIIALPKRVLKHLKKQKRKKSQSPVKERCPVEDSTEDRIDYQVKLRCRQLTTVVQELRKAIMRQDWDEATTLLMILCHPGLKYYSSIIIRTSFILLCNHPSSNLNLLKNFIRQMTQYILEEDVNKFLRILFILRKSGLDSLERGKYIRKTGDYKVTRDPEFEKL